MKYFLYLYPISAYWDWELNNHLCNFVRYPVSPGKINDLIQARYRGKGYQIFWLFFGKPCNPIRPRRANQTDWIMIYPEDRIVSAGVTWSQLMRNNPPVYPEVDFVLGHLDEPIDELVLGGFHTNDCVERIARKAHARGIQTWVDEDCTESFFIRTHEIPLEWHPSQGTHWFIDEVPDNMRVDCIQHRGQRPWLACPRIR